MANVWADESRAMGIAPLVTIDVYTVQNRLITSQTSMLVGFHTPDWLIIGCIWASTLWTMST
ncbi:MAG: hypothetical protein PVI09_00595 [Anaerolineae bacterium]